MRLADFIRHNTEAIVEEWEAFAATLLPAAASMTSLALRDHAEPILEAIATDLRTAQTAQERAEKSKGRGAASRGASETAAQTHAVLRAQSGFGINQLVAEYRALRASVLRLWSAETPLDEMGVEEIIRFDEAIDQAVAESVGHFHAQVEKARNLFLGMLGHDLRSPLDTILTTASALAALNAGEQVSGAANRLIRSGASMRALLDDLVDFNRTNLGLGIKVVPRATDLAEVVSDELEQLRAAHPTRRIELEVSGDTRGRWDGPRLQQLLRNLVSNAVKFGSPDTPVRVAVRGEATDVYLEVRNQGPSIDDAARREIFEPLRRGPAPESGEETSPEGLGLGLFIVEQIVVAHGGAVEVLSGDEGTSFVSRLPREAAESS